jgi:F-type H+-transporting ATPase subunit gamma
MSNIKEIVSRIHSINSTQQITKTMKLVAAAKLAKAQHQLLQLRPYAHQLSTIINHVLVNTDPSLLQPYIRQSKVQKLLLVVMSTDRGLCGSFNANIIKKTEAYLKENSGLAPEQIDLLVIGKKAYTYFQKKDYPLITTYQSISTKLQFEAVDQAAHWMTHAFITQQYDRIEFVYNLFGNAATQFVQVEPFLPLVHPLAMKPSEHPHYLYEPSQAELIETLIPLSLTTQFYKALLESNASEHGARMTTMSKATDNAEALLKTLRITYNKTRQASITNEILEIAAGAEALKH